MKTRIETLKERGLNELQIRQNCLRQVRAYFEPDYYWNETPPAVDLRTCGFMGIDIHLVSNGGVKLTFHLQRPGMLIGLHGRTIEQVQKDLTEMLGVTVSIGIIEVNPWELNGEEVS